MSDRAGAQTTGKRTGATGERPDGPVSGTGQPAGDGVHPSAARILARFRSITDR